MSSIEEVVDVVKSIISRPQLQTARDAKVVVGGANSASDVISESTSTGTCWTFAFNCKGILAKAILISATNAITPQCRLWLYTKVPTCGLLDNAAMNGPVAADVNFLVGWIDFPAMNDSGSGHSFSIATPSTPGNAPLTFDKPTLYGVLESVDACTPGAVLWTILLEAEKAD